MKTVVLLYGFPGSGKTAAARALRALVSSKDDSAYAASGPLPTGVTATILNVDAIRYEVNNGVWYDAHTESQVMRHAYAATKALLSTNDVVIVDEAFLMTAQWDRYFTKLFGGAPEKYRVVRVRVDTSERESFRRNSLRERVVPPAAYAAMANGAHKLVEDIRMTVNYDNVVFEF